MGMTINDRCRISGDGPTLIGSGGTLVANIECKIYSGISSCGDVTIKDSSVVNGNIFTHGSVYKINQPVINGYCREGMDVDIYSIPTQGVTPGSSDKPIPNYGTLVLPPGNYRDLTANSFSTLRLSAGVYQFRKFIAYTDVHIVFNAPDGEVIIKVANELNLGDRTHMELSSGYSNPLNVRWYSNQYVQLNTGTVSQLIGLFTLPNHTFAIGGRTTLKGAVRAKNIVMDPDAIIEKCTDTRYVDSDFDDVPDIVETAMGTNPSSAASTPKVAKPSSWYADASKDMVVHYDLSMFPKYFKHTDVPITIPAGVNNRAYNPIMSIMEPEEIGVPLALPEGNRLDAAYHILAGIAPGTTLLLGFPLPGASSIDIHYNNIDNYLLQHYNDSTHLWETIPMAYVDDDVAYANVSSNQWFALSDVPVGLNTITNLRVCVDDNGAAVIEEKNYADPLNDMVINSAQRLNSVAYSLDQFRTILPQLRYRFVPTPPTAATTDLRLHWVENAVTLCSEKAHGLNYWIAGESFIDGTWEHAPNFNRVAGVAADDNTIVFNPYNLHYTLHGTDFVAREEIYDEWNRNLREEVYRREFITDRSVVNHVTGAALHPENDVFHPAGNTLAGADLAWVIRHELGHCMGLGGDNQLSDYINMVAISQTDPTPDNSCPACACANSQYENDAGVVVTGQCRPMIDEWEGLICYENHFPNKAQYYNNNMMREFDARDMVANTDFVVSYPYIRMFVRMQNRDGDRYTSTNWYDVRYRMLETPFSIGAVDNNPQRFFVMGLDSVVVSTEVGLVYAHGLCIDQTNGDVYFGDYARIVKKDALGVVSPVAGTGVSGYVNGPAATAQFDGNFCAPFCRDNTGALYVCERNANRIRKISGGSVTLFAGSDAGTPGDDDGTGSAARFWWPSSMCIDAANNIYVADYNNHRIRRITPAGVVTTLAGTGAAGNLNGSFAAAQFNYPCGIAIDEDGNLYVADRVNVDIRLLDIGTNTVTTFAGNGTSAHVDGPVAAASFVAISDLHVDARGIVYVADADMIRMVRDGVVSTIAGRSGDPVPYRDGCGTDARFRGANDVATDARGNLYVSESLHTTLRKISTHVPITVNAPQLGARVENPDDAVWFEFTVTDNLDHTVTVTPDALLLGTGDAVPPAPNTVGVDAELFGPDNEYLPVLNGSETDGDGVSIVKNMVTDRLATGRYLLRVSAHDPGHASGAFTVQVTNTRQDIAVPAAAGASTTVAGNLEGEGDNDWFRIDVPVVVAPATVSLTLETTNRSAGLTTAPVLYMYRDNEGLPVDGVPRVSTPAGVTVVPGVTEDDVDAGNTIPLIRRILRDGRSQINQVEFGPNPRDDNRVNHIDIYWIRVRAGNPSATGTYTLRVTRN